MNKFNKPTIPDLTTVILCGGQGSRLNNQNKPLVSWKGKPLVEYVADSLPESTERLISANRDLEQYSNYGKVVTDSITEFESNSPLVGIFAALHEMVNEWLLCVPGDTPLLQKDWESPLLVAASNKSIVCARDKKCIQPLHLLIHIAEKKHLRSYLLKGRKSAIDFLNERKAKTVEFANNDMFRNFNTTADFF